MKKRIKRTKKAKQEATQLAEEPMVDDAYDDYYDDVRSNPAYFIGGGSILFREFLEKSPLVAKAYFLESPNSNALGYQVMAETQQAISR